MKKAMQLVVVIGLIVVAGISFVYGVSAGEERGEGGPIYSVGVCALDAINAMNGMHPSGLQEQIVCFSAGRFSGEAGEVLAAQTAAKIVREGTSDATGRKWYPPSRVVDVSVRVLVR